MTEVATAKAGTNNKKNIMVLDEESDNQGDKTTCKSKDIEINYNQPPPKLIETERRRDQN